jgi:hypothetical protein
MTKMNDQRLGSHEARKLKGLQASQLSNLQAITVTDMADHSIRWQV